MKKELQTGHSGGDKCPDEITLLNYALRDLSSDEAQLIETHLENCDPCLSEVREFVEIRNCLNDGTPDIPTPAALIETVRRQWEDNGAETVSVPTVPSLIIQLAAEGIRLLKESILPEGASVEWAASPRYALRGDGEPHEGERMTAAYLDASGNLSISIEVRKDGRESLQAAIALEKASKPLSDRHIKLRRGNRIVRSKKTGPDGILVFSELHPAKYHIEIPSETAELEINIVP